MAAIVPVAAFRPAPPQADAVAYTNFLVKIYHNFQIFTVLPTRPCLRKNDCQYKSNCLFHLKCTITMYGFYWRTVDRGLVWRRDCLKLRPQVNRGHAQRTELSGEYVRCLQKKRVSGIAFYHFNILLSFYQITYLFFHTLCRWVSVIQLG